MPYNKPVILLCKKCHKEFKVPYYMRTRIFCSMKCYKPSQVIKICLECGKNFKARLSHIIQGEGKYCSVKCRSKSKIYLEKISKANLNAWETGKKKSTIQKGSKHHWWKGGIARLPYPYDFNEALREIIRKRDNHKCVYCGVPQEECVKNLHVHHIDFNKDNLNPNNLVAICNSCHSTITANKYLKKNA